jgi:hypothetical protein
MPLSPSRTLASLTDTFLVMHEYCKRENRNNTVVYSRHLVSSLAGKNGDTHAMCLSLLLQERRRGRAFSSHRYCLQSPLSQFMLRQKSVSERALHPLLNGHLSSVAKNGTCPFFATDKKNSASTGGARMRGTSSIARTIETKPCLSLCLTLVDTLVPTHPLPEKSMQVK